MVGYWVSLLVPRAMDALTVMVSRFAVALGVIPRSTDAVSAHALAAYPLAARNSIRPIIRPLAVFDMRYPPDLAIPEPFPISIPHARPQSTEFRAASSPSAQELAKAHSREGITKNPAFK